MKLNALNEHFDCEQSSEIQVIRSFVRLTEGSLAPPRARQHKRAPAGYRFPQDTGMPQDFRSQACTMAHCAKIREPFA
jgi:hypothetical protein